MALWGGNGHGYEFCTRFHEIVMVMLNGYCAWLRGLVLVMLNDSYEEKFML